jgi:hypothetical protein
VTQQKAVCVNKIVVTTITYAEHCDIKLFVRRLPRTKKLSFVEQALIANIHHMQEKLEYYYIGKGC